MAAGGAAVLSGCGRHTAGAVPHVAQESLSAQDRVAEGQRTQKVLENPIIGETLLWPSAPIPTGWLVCKGQLLQVADYRFLFRVLRNSAGGDGKKTFRLPNVKAVTRIVAIAGTYPGTLGPLKAALKARMV